MSIQTLTTKDLNTVTLNGCAGYEISKIETLYNTMYLPEGTISNIIMGELANYIYTHNIKDMTPEGIEKSVMSKLNLSEYGINVIYFKLINFAVVKTYRLIQYHSWFNEGIRLTDSK